MIILESKLIDEVYVDGYYLTLKDLERLVRDFQADCHDGFVSNDCSYIEHWLKKHNRILPIPTCDSCGQEMLKDPLGNYACWNSACKTQQLKKD